MGTVNGIKIGVLEPDHFSEDALQQLAELGSVTCFNGGDLQGFLSKLTALFVRLGYQIDGEFLNKCPNLKYLCSPTTGHNHIDETEIVQRQIKLLSLRGDRKFLENIRATPEHTFGMIIALLRNYKLAMTHVEKGGWNRDQLRGEELKGQTVGIIGLGRVGYRVAVYCEAFDAECVYFDENPVRAKSRWGKMKSVEATIEACRILVMCASHINGIPPILGEREIKLLEDRYFINTARGELVDESALFNMIAKGKIRGVATDVIASETGENQLSRWRELASANANVIITPHIAGATVSSIERTERHIANQLSARLRADKQM